MSKAMIRIEHLKKSYEAGTPLTDVNAEVGEGEIISVIGPSGTGKSTLLRCINLLEKPTDGEVLIDGKSITQLPKKELLKLRQSIGMIFQGFNLLEQRNVIGNICFPLEIAGMKKKEARQKAMEYLETVDLSEKAKAYPAQLSGGQKQRVGIARALASDPKVLLCDEATSALDTATTQSILSILQDINRERGVTVIVITHEMKVIDQICERVAVIDSSRIVEVGQVSSVFTNPQSQIAKQLILPQAKGQEYISGGKRLRIVFDGEAASKPIISNLVLDCQVPVNICFADTKQMEGKSYGHMIVEIPDEERQYERVCAYLTENHVTFEKEV